MKTPAFLCITALFLTSLCPLFAQPPEVLWTKTLNGQIGYSVYPAEGGGFVIGGYTVEDGYRDFYMCKVDGQGDLLWEKTFGNDDRNETLNAMIETSDGGFLLAGNRAEDYPSSSTDIYLVKTDSEGEQEWYSIMGQDDESENPVSVAETSEGGFIMCGSYWYDGFNGYDIVMFKVTELGALEWKEYFNLDDASADHGMWVETAPDGGFIVAGKTQAFTTNWDDDAFIMKVTPLGTLESITTIGEAWPMYEGAHRLLQCSDGAWLICGYQNDDWLDNNWYVVKTGDNGWTHIIGGTYHEKAFNACETTDGGYAVTGNYHFENSWNSFIVRYTADGDTLWTKMWGDPDQSQNNYDIKQLDDGGFITVGSTAGTGNPNVYLTRLSAGTTGVKDVSQSGLNTIEILAVQPNPFREITRLTYQLDRESSVKVILYDVTGTMVSLVAERAQAPGIHELDIGEGLPPGIYFCHLRSEGSSIVRRLVRTK
jgi:hypothetical protein